MSLPARSCLRCRQSKVKCDLVRPTCGRCARRGTVCDGYNFERGFSFRDETARAQFLSQRARRRPQDEATATEEPELEEGSRLEVSRNVDDIALQSQLSWLNERALITLPPQVKQDVETRAVERFFSNWIVSPSELSPGYMHHLPALYESTAADSVLHQTVLAVAFADIPEYKLKGLQKYGAAITGLRSVAKEPTSFNDDQSLAALLMIDTFETLYMGRNEPLGLHDKALEYVLEARGIEQFHSARRFCLWRIAVYRLQARQLLLGKEMHGKASGGLQQTLLDSLNQERPDLRVLFHVSRIIHLCSEADRLMGQELAIASIKDLLQDISTLVFSIENWTSALDSSFKPTPMLADLTSRFHHLRTSEKQDPDHPMDAFTCPGMLHHQDITLAFLWSFYAAAQIILREHTIKLLRRVAPISDTPQSYLDRTRGEELAIDGLSGSIIRSFPQFMGFDESTGKVGKTGSRDGGSKASSLGRFLGVFAMIVVRDAEGTSEGHKRCAVRVLQWMRRRYSME